MAKIIISKNNAPEPEEVPIPSFSVTEIARLIASRRSIFTANFTGETISKDHIELLLRQANWAPTHGKTEPWRFVVFSGESKKKFGEQHGALYQALTDETAFSSEKHHKITHLPDTASHIIAIGMKKDETGKIPEVEEICAVAAAVQNMQLMATAMGLGAYWSTGGMTFKKEMRTLLGWDDHHLCLGFLYVGKPKQWAKGYRKTDISTKVRWEE